MNTWLDPSEVRPNTEAQARSLQDYLQRARALLTIVEQARGQHSTLEEQLATAQTSLRRLQAAVQQAQTVWTDWKSSWQAAVEAAGYDRATKAEQVEAEAEAIQEVTACWWIPETRAHGSTVSGTAGRRWKSRE